MASNSNGSDSSNSQQTRTNGVGNAVDSPTRNRDQVRQDKSIREDISGVWFWASFGDITLSIHLSWYSERGSRKGHKQDKGDPLGTSPRRGINSLMDFDIKARGDSIWHRQSVYLWPGNKLSEGKDIQAHSRIADGLRKSWWNMMATTNLFSHPFLFILLSYFHLYLLWAVYGRDILRFASSKPARDPASSCKDP